MRITQAVAVLLLLIGCGARVATKSASETARTRIQRAPTPEPLVGDIGFEELIAVNLLEHEAFADLDVREGDFRGVRLVDLMITATRPDDADLAFLGSLSFFASAPGLPEVLVATQHEFPDGVAEATFDLEDVDLTEYVKSEALTITTQVSGQTPDHDTTVEISFTVDVGVTARGACRNL